MMQRLTSSPRARGLALLSLPLLSVLLPNIIIGYGFVIPGSCIAGINEHTIGYAASILGTIPAYIGGVVLAGRLARD